ncbi:MAG: hypothetical protein AAGE59_14670 [Cyanobacteria bacterium P01_F01_bin.86]
MTAFSNKTQSTARARSTRRRKISWLGLFLVLSPFITLSSIGLSTVSIFYSLRINQSLVAQSTIQDTTQTATTLSQKDTQNNDLSTRVNAASANDITVSNSGETAIQLAPAEFYRLITLSILEAPTPAGRLDVIQAVFNRLHAPQAGLGHYGDTISKITFAPGQFEPYFHLTPEEIVDFDSAVSVLVQERGYTVTEAKAILEQVITDISNPQRMANAREHVGGRTSFKGTTQYANRVPSEDPLRTERENFFHIDHDQTYQQLTQLEQLGPTIIQLKQSNH